MPDELVCYRCGASLETLTLPLSRLDECPACTVQLHVCRMCVYYDPRVAKQCREDDAEEVKEKERANFCDYFKPRADAFSGRELAAEQKAKAELDSLFDDKSGGNSNSEKNPPSGDDTSAAEDLFK